MKSLSIFYTKGRQREISIFRGFILEVMVDLTFIEYFLHAR